MSNNLGYTQATWMSPLDWLALRFKAVLKACSGYILNLTKDFCYF